MPAIVRACANIKTAADDIIRRADERGMKGAVDESIFAREMADLKLELKKIRTSKKYGEIQRTIAADFSHFLLSDSAAGESSRNWLLIHPDQQKEAIRYKYGRLARIQSARTGIDVPSPAITWEYVSDKDSDNCLTCASVWSSISEPPETYFTVFNLHGDTGMTRSAYKTDSIAAHEGAHHLEACLAWAAVSGNLPRTSPYYEDAMIFAEINRSGAVLPLRLGSAYLASPIEEDANAFQHEVERRISKSYNGRLRSITHSDMHENAIQAVMGWRPLFYY